MKRSGTIGWPLAAGGIVMLAALLTPDVTAGPFRNPWRTTTSVERLAKQLDCVERSLQYYGRVTVKAPDVWGQARLTAFRQEFEREMAKQLTRFPEESVQANIAVTDQAFLSEAIALGAASRGGTPPSFATSSTKNADGTTTTTNSTVTSVSSGLLTAPTAGAAPASQETTANTIIRTVPNGLISGTDAPTLTIEPEILLDERKRYLDHLHEIRRVNEGDDSVDAPGYALNLVRIPVSLIPGDKTRENYGAEVTLTAESHVTEELLASTFRELVINDLVDQLALPIVKIVEDRWSVLASYEATLALDFEKHPLSNSQAISIASRSDFSKGALSPFSPSRIQELIQNPASRSMLSEPELAQFNKALSEVNDNTKQKENTLLEMVSSIKQKYQPLFSSRERRSRYPIPASQLSAILGEQELAQIALAAYLVREHLACRERLNLTDVQGFLRNELQAAFDYLNNWERTLPDGTASEAPVWYSDAMPNVSAIRRVDDSFLKCNRYALYRNGSSADPEPKDATQALAWAICVESALLNEQLNQDLQRVSQDPNCHCVPAGQDCPFIFYGPNPDPAAKMAFAEYVKCRWPVRVFALDPVTQQQNVGDVFSLRREMQLAIALAFSRGRVNAQSLTRYMRRIEQDIRTISLNQTAVGFGSGDDTFGWRFFPRVQTPGVESNLTVLTRDMLIGGPGKDAILKQRRMEPGMRECTALVVMPSFVKHVRFDVRTNWFPLVPCHVPNAFHVGRTPPSMEQTVEWSRMIKTMEDSVAMCIQDEHLYRDGEVERMLKRAHQLSQELPINTMHAQVPYENTLGGFEMFSSGVTDLAPELVGFYGAPGINPNGATELFLVGKNFSVTGTRVIAGNVNLDAAQNQFSLLSRQVMQVSIPRGVQIESRLSKPREATAESAKPGECDDKYVEIRLATPYGVSSPLLVPLAPPATKEPPAPQLSWAQDSYRVRYLWKKAAVDGQPFEITDVRVAGPLEFKISVPKSVAVPNSAVTVQVAIAGQDHGLIGDDGTTPAEIASVAFNVADRTYAIDAANFINLQKAIKSSVVAKVQRETPTAPPSSPYIVRLTATVKLGDNATRLPLAGELKIPITFTPAQ